MSFFSAVEMAPRDPILGLNDQFAADTNPAKVNLGVGVYYDDQGKLPLLGCVQAAEQAMMATPKARGYLPIDGLAAYDAGVKALVFGADSEPIQSARVATVQAIGGTGGLKIGADFLHRLNPRAEVPALVLPDKSVMTESAAILIYLAERFPRAGLAPPPPRRVRTRPSKAAVQRRIDAKKRRATIKRGRATRDD